MLGRWLTLVLVLTCSVPAAEAHIDLTEETLRQIFPQAAAFTARQKALSPPQIAELERLTGSRITGEDRVVIFYVAIGRNDEGAYQSLGAVFVIHESGPQGVIDVAIGYDLQYRVKGIVIIENRNDQGIEKPDFLKQLIEKGPHDALALGQDIEFGGDGETAEGLIRAVKRGMQLLHLVLKKG